jgi:hypothetical protein
MLILLLSEIKKAEPFLTLPHQATSRGNEPHSKLVESQKEPWKNESKVHTQLHGVLSWKKQRLSIKKQAGCRENSDDPTGPICCARTKSDPHRRIRHSRISDLGENMLAFITSLVSPPAGGRGWCELEKKFTSGIYAIE